MRNYVSILSLAIIAVSPMSAIASNISRAISLTATISDPTSVFQVEAVSGSWPNTDQSITYSSTNGSFSNPAAVGFKVKSSQDVSVSLSSTAKLVDGLKEIPLDVSITAQDTTKGTTVSSLSLVGQKLYEKTKNTAGDFAFYNLEIKASKTNMKDATGTVISNTTASPGKPTAGAYTGSVDLVFDSTI